MASFYWKATPVGIEYREKDGGNSRTEYHVKLICWPHVIVISVLSFLRCVNTSVYGCVCVSVSVRATCVKQLRRNSVSFRTFTSNGCRVTATSDEGYRAVVEERATQTATVWERAEHGERGGGARDSHTLLHTRKMLSNCITSKNNKQIVKIRQLCTLQLQ